MIKTNDTLRFVLPMFYNAKLGLNKEFFLNKFLIGAFTSDFKRPEFDDKLLLAYEYFPSDEYIEFENKLKAILNPYIYQDDENLDMYIYVLNIPKEYDEDYALIITGMYENISPDLKLKITKMWGLKSEDNLFKVLVGKADYEGEQFEDEILNLNN